jgi:hypothetical protein
MRLIYELRNSDTQRRDMAVNGWLARDSADRNSVIYGCRCDVFLIELRASLLRINASKSLSSLEDEGRRYLRNDMIRLPPAAAACGRRAKSKTCRWKEIFESRFTVALTPRGCFDMYGLGGVHYSRSRAATVTLTSRASVTLTRMRAHYVIGGTVYISHCHIAASFAFVPRSCA